jgi:uncharacterized protein GlcG (DUF336 family)
MRKTLICISKIRLWILVLLLVFSGSAVWTLDSQAGSKGAELPDYEKLTEALNEAVKQNNGGIFSPNKMWAAVVDRQGRVVAVTKTPGQDAWPGSRVIAMQKAYTANAFSNNALALSTANLYSAVQPGGSLYGLQHSNPINTELAYKGPAKNFGTANDPATRGENNIVGGVNVFGGGLALYDPETGEVLGGLGVSGDSSCADHVIAWRIRHALGFNRVPGGVNTGSYGGATAPDKGDDNIIFDPESGFGHPECGFTETEVNDLPSVENF